MKTLDQVIRFVTIATALTGCASGGNINFHAAAAPSVQHVAKLDAPFAIPVPISAQIVAFEEAPVDDVAIDALPDADVALLQQQESAHEYARSFALAPHVSAISFHCTSGEESLGCKAKPVEPFIERDVEAIFGRE
jgi:hypothetical protein